MVITFDPVKRAKNLNDRQLDFLDAEIVLSGPVFTVEDTRIDYASNVFRRSDSLPSGW
jgi:uncharacterized DUF497 family protein